MRNLPAILPPKLPMFPRLSMPPKPPPPLKPIADGRLKQTALLLAFVIQYTDKTQGMTYRLQACSFHHILECPYLRQRRWSQVMTWCLLKLISTYINFGNGTGRHWRLGNQPCVTFTPYTDLFCSGMPVKRYEKFLTDISLDCDSDVLLSFFFLTLNFSSFLMSNNVMTLLPAGCIHLISLTHIQTAVGSKDKMRRCQLKPHS